MPELMLKRLPASLQNNPEKIAFLALAGSISMVLVSIAASQILLAAAILGFVWNAKKSKSTILSGAPAILPLLAFMAWTLIAALAASNMLLGLNGIKKFGLYILVLLVPSIVRGEGRLTWIYRAIFLVAVVSSVGGLVQFAINPHRDLVHRISGFMSQWMTYSGLLMLVIVLLTAFALCAGLRSNKWVIPVAAIIVLALILTLTRNAWIGAIAGIIVLILMRRPRAMVVLLAAILCFYAISPGVIKQRLNSIVDASDPRFHVYLTAMHMIQDHPWFGVGPKNVSYEAPKYREEKEFPNWLKRSVELFSNRSKYQEEEKVFPGWLYQHMHNNFLQIAAEIGIPGLVLWLWFMFRLAWDALRCYRYASGPSFSSGEGLRKEALTASSAALAAWVAFMIAGMFEYNFGDSEVLTLFLFIVSTPYAFKPQRVEVPPSELQASKA
jgi:putative inorganic carbon (HCO3(-)) transporter